MKIKSTRIYNFLSQIPITTYSAVVMIAYSLLLGSADRIHILIAASVIAGHDVIYMSVMSIVKGRLLSADLFTFAAIIGTFALGRFNEAAISMAVYSICRYYNINAVNRVRAENVFGDENATWTNAVDKRPSDIEKKVRKRSWLYSVVSLAAIVVLTVIVPVVWRRRLTVWLYRAFVLLAMSKGTAAGLCVSFEFTRVKEIGNVDHIQYKCNQAIENAGRITSVVFSRLESAPEDIYEIKDVIPQGVSRDTLLTAAAYACCFSSAPEAYYLVQGAGVEIDRGKVDMYKEIPELGSAVILKGIRITAGSSQLMGQLGIKHLPEDKGYRYIHICVENKYAGCIKMAKKTGTADLETVRVLHKAGIDRVILIANENDAKVKAEAESIGADEVWFEAGEENMVKKLQNLRNMQLEGEMLAYAGSGAESREMLKSADVGIEIGSSVNGIGDIVISDGDYLKTAKALKLSKRLMNNIYRKLSHIMLLKAISVILAFCGLSGIWLSSILDCLAVAEAVRDYDKK